MAQRWLLNITVKIFQKRCIYFFSQLLILTNFMAQQIILRTIQSKHKKAQIPHVQ